MCLLNPEERRLQRDLTAAFQPMKQGESLVTRACHGRTMGNDSKLKECQSRLDMRKMLFYSEGEIALELVAQRQ